MGGKYIDYSFKGSELDSHVIIRSEVGSIKLSVIIRSVARFLLMKGGKVFMAGHGLK